jgi:hypothetical protein
MTGLLPITFTSYIRVGSIPSNLMRAAAVARRAPLSARTAMTILVGSGSGHLKIAPIGHSTPSQITT